ncbi:hypothetical protein T4B_1494 [Trichinella pseudospiralis]|uniref:Uncharacterized protein n=1 Tax=Trichinella pseudospiralis TaxID=6337 RepID=A0A0V1GHH5_TRIPS|nr:hypothetical protein T4B_1494 [Trichinella pseudospiralis]
MFSYRFLKSTPSTLLFSLNPLTKMFSYRFLKSSP